MHEVHPWSQAAVWFSGQGKRSANLSLLLGLRTVMNEALPEQ